MYKVYFITFGCKVNSCETESMKRLFLEHGFVLAEDEASADVFIVNSCTVTQGGDSKSLYAVRRLKHAYSGAVVALTGCLPQAAEQGREICPEADIIAGTNERAALPGLVEACIDGKKRITRIVPHKRGDSFEKLPVGGLSKGGRTRGFLKIQDGCDCFCSYCLIPYARGRCRSKPLQDVAEDAGKLAETGHREIVLVGINLAFYGREYGLRLVDAVEVCCRIDGIQRVRLGSIEPEMLSEDDLLRLSMLPEFCPQFHLSLQSGSRATLERMNRKYTPGEYAAIVDKIRKYFPDASFTTDIMVGFPEETDEEFSESLEFAEKIGFSKIHVFRYSRRKGTPAEKMKQVSENVKSERWERMNRLGEKLSRKYLESLVGRTVPVLFEKENSPDFHRGHAPDHTLVEVPVKKSEKNMKNSLRNSVFYVIIEECRGDHCIGSIVSGAE
ncbi:MAG: tRNA (N(6)-L-threonylcarbamoyladenosine(37)-C(2))-methylthiotransferase MtaB [Ruminococcus sp.]|nr:tRNA (N(6)-L-threonylcarbamoyladenosine(37)-C(2))-methylthiotransferase MtaB [Ruminococcus sp.]